MILQIFPLNYITNGKITGLKGCLNPDQKQKIKVCGELKYSKTYNSRFLPYYKEVYQNLNEQFSNITVLYDYNPLQTVEELHHTGIACNALPIDSPELPNPPEENVIIESRDKESSQRMHLQNIFQKARNGANVIKKM